MLYEQVTKNLTAYFFQCEREDVSFFLFNKQKAVFAGVCVVG